MYFNEKTIVFQDGDFRKVSDSGTNFYSQSLHYGLGVFEGIRSYNTPNGVKIFKAKEHYDRLRYSAEKMHIKLTYSTDELIDITYRLLDKNNLKNAYIRPLVTTGPNMSLLVSDEVHIFIAVWEWGKYLGDKLLNGFISSYQRPNPKSCHIDTKTTGHYINSILARTEAMKNDAEEAILLDSDGYVAEGTGENIFVQKNNELFTPALGNILPGITRATVLELAKQNGIKVVERHFYPEELTNADTAFCTGTASEVTGLKSLNKLDYPVQWKDSIGYFISQKFFEYVNS